MATPIYVPRINNNDDEVKILAFDVAVGAKVTAEQIVGQVETDKAVLDVTAPSTGYVLGFVGVPEEVVKVGSVMLWLGETPEEAIPEVKNDCSGKTGQRASQITAKARIMIAQHALQAEHIPEIDGRITIEAVERYLSENGLAATKRDAKFPVANKHADALPDVSGSSVDLTREEKGMAATVAWHRDFAVPGYIEIDYDLSLWAEYAKHFQEEKGLLMPPLLPLMAWRLVEVAREIPRLNATFVGNKRYEYDPVNLGFTIQAGEALYLAVVRSADQLDQLGFVNSLGDVLRRAAGHNLRESEASGATIGFSSMERWKVIRHIPILPPHTALMVAHAAGQGGRGVLGASYDHRVLNGGQVVAALKKLSQPKKN
jgi:pyruvate/2-oxoglutarate dehydrogenase complex dihydrolipoamide acyltransferase (E2) component